MIVAILILISTAVASKVVIRRKTQAVCSFLPFWYLEIDKCYIFKVRVVVSSHIAVGFYNFLTCKYGLVLMQAKLHCCNP